MERNRIGKARYSVHHLRSRITAGRETGCKLIIDILFRPAGRQVHLCRRIEIGENRLIGVTRFCFINVAVEIGVLGSRAKRPEFHKLMVGYRSRRVMRDIPVCRRQLQCRSSDVRTLFLHCQIQAFDQRSHLRREITGSLRSVTDIAIGQAVPIPTVSVPIILFLSRHRLMHKIVVEVFIRLSADGIRGIHRFVGRHEVEIRTAISDKATVARIAHGPIGTGMGKSRSCGIDAGIADRTSTDAAEFLYLLFHHGLARPKTVVADVCIPGFRLRGYLLMGSHPGMIFQRIDSCGFQIARPLIHIQRIVEDTSPSVPEIHLFPRLFKGSQRQDGRAGLIRIRRHNGKYPRQRHCHGAVHRPVTIGISIVFVLQLVCRPIIDEYLSGRSTVECHIGIAVSIEISGKGNIFRRPEHHPVDGKGHIELGISGKRRKRYIPSRRRGTVNGKVIYSVTVKITGQRDVSGQSELTSGIDVPLTRGKIDVPGCQSSGS